MMNNLRKAPKPNWVTPLHIETRGLSFLWWTSSVKIVCGYCSKPFKSSIQHSNIQNHWCDHCGTRNRFEVEWENIQ